MCVQQYFESLVRSAECWQSSMVLANSSVVTSTSTSFEKSIETPKASFNLYCKTSTWSHEPSMLIKSSACWNADEVHTQEFKSLDLVSALCKCIGREKPSVNRTGSLPVAHRQSFCQKELPEWSGAQLGSVQVLSSQENMQTDAVSSSGDVRHLHFAQFTSPAFYFHLALVTVHGADNCPTDGEAILHQACHWLSSGALVSTSWVEL